MNPTQDLTHEHEIVKQALKILDQLCDRVETGEKPNTEHLTQIFEFLTVFVDTCHHGKEEELLFPAMEQIGGAQVKPMLTQMLSEHQTGRTFVKKMKQAFADYNAGQAKAISALIENARGYITLLNNHIIKEDTILYVVADQLLTPVQQKDVMEGFKKIEQERIGAGKHAEFHQFIHQLENIYLS